MSQFFFELTPDRVLEAVEASGLKATGRCMALNSFENRVYDVELEWEGDEPPSHASAARRVVKFYRPGRWSEAQILREHEFIQDLVEAEIPAVAPIPFADGRTLHATRVGAIWYAVFPKVGGRSPDELMDDQLIRIGRLLGRMHSIGKTRSAPERITIDPVSYGLSNLELLLASGRIPLDFSKRYEAAVKEISRLIAPVFSEIKPQRLHGDCHLGNLLWNPEGPFFVDFDDMVQGPPIQDLWLLLPGRPSTDPIARRQLDLLLEGYEEMHHFDRSTIRLIEPLRALRLIHYAAWIEKRWDDPAFPLAFPQFTSHRYWSDQTDDLETQLRIIQSDPAWV